MKAETYPFVVRPLPYEYDALCPILTEETLRYHHDKHYQTYVDNLNSVLSDYPNLQQQPLVAILTHLDRMPKAAREKLRNNGGGVYNHELYFDSMRSPEGQEPEGELAKALIRDFGSYKDFMDAMKQTAISQFGSGWAWLVADADGKLSITQTANQDVPDLNIYVPIFLMDVWEHAYYLQYKNRRADYANDWFQLIHWRKANMRYVEMKPVGYADEIR